MPVQQQITYKQVIVAGLLKTTISMMNERQVKRRAKILSSRSLYLERYADTKAIAKSGN